MVSKGRGRFSLEYKKAILKEVCKAPRGKARASILKREGLEYYHLANWLCSVASKQQQKQYFRGTNKR